MTGIDGDVRKVSRAGAKVSSPTAPMLRSVLLWALVLAAGAFALQWLEYRFQARALSREIYIALIGVAFAVGGVWVGWKLNTRKEPDPFQPNTAAVASLGLTRQEVKVLERLAAGGWPIQQGDRPNPGGLAQYG
ncbi:hypothetical protein [Phenylobacterium ferrooxidans]|uniref:hypothetical protein n=1 Tax=Phenylobacterium ferrooxidans TaxID=2982689 RepID=UPI00366F804D